MRIKTKVSNIRGKKIFTVIKLANIKTKINPIKLQIVYKFSRLFCIRNV